jgi:hypothetical protein
MRLVFAVPALAVVSGLAAYGQNVISAHSGVLHVSEGAVFLADKPVDQKFGTFPDIKENQELRTELGRAEVLLTPGVFLRVGENSSVRMITNRLIDTRVEFISGEAIVESADPMKENSVTVAYKDFQVHVKKSAVLSFQSEPAQLKVYNGEADVELNGSSVTLKAGKMMPFTAALAAERFDSKDTDTLARWSKQRSQYVSIANMSAAKSLKDGGNWNGNTGAWAYNSFYSMYTYIPGRGTLYSPYGYGLWSPYTVYSAYYQPRYDQNYYNNGFGGNNSGMAASNNMSVSPNYSGVRSGGGSVSAPAMASAPVSAGATSGGSAHVGGHR